MFYKIELTKFRGYLYLSTFNFNRVLLFLFNLLTIAFPKPISLTDDNYEILKDPNGKPLIIELLDPNCKNCQSILSTIEEIINSEYSKKINLAEINCHENSNLCSSLTNKNTYPQIVWVDSDTKQKFLYQENEYSSNNIKRFIQNQLSFPFIFLDDKDKISEIKKEERQNSIFILYYKNKNDEKFQVAKKAAKSIIIQTNHYQFYAVEDKKFKFSAIREKDSESFYHGDWSQDTLSLFIKRRLFPTLVEFNKKTITQLKNSHRLSLIAFLDPSIYLSDWKHLAQEVESDYQFSYVIYSSKNTYVRLFGIQSTNLPQVVLFDANNQRWIPYENDLTDTGLTKWIGQLDLTNAHWQVPKSGLFSNMQLSFASILTNGGIFFYIFLLLLIGIIALAIKFFNGYFNKKPHHKRGSDRAYETL